METPSCPNHGPMTWKTGNAKATGKPYAFWTCPTKLPDGSWCPTKGPKNAPPVAQPPVLGGGTANLMAEATIHLGRIADALEKIADKDLKEIPF